MYMARSALSFLLLTGPIFAQQAIVNMPSADITPKGKTFLMHETQWRPQAQGRYWYGTNFFAHGIGFKSSPQFFAESHPELELKLTVGQMAIINHRGKGLGSFSYSHLSFRTPGTHTRLTAGGFYGTEELFLKNTGNFLASFEQPLFHHKMQIVGEWLRGKHDFGFFIPGVSFHLPKNQVIVVAYKIANNKANGANGLVLEYGLTF
jgi:hypothetical protein